MWSSSRASVQVVGDWRHRLHPGLVSNLGKFRRYHYGSVRELLRVIRNKAHHYRELELPVREELGTMPEGFVSYFCTTFPLLFLYVYTVLAVFAGNSREGQCSILKVGACSCGTRKECLAVL